MPSRGNCARKYTLAVELMRAASIKTHIWAGALIRRAQIGGAFAYVMQKGDADSGITLIKVATLDGNAVLYSPARNMAGEKVFLPSGPKPEGDITQSILKRMTYDPDLWVIEIEDREGRHFLTEPVEHDG